jgi:hypothetical protein
MKYAKTFFDEMVPESLSSAKIIVPLVMDLLHPTSVVDVGCATGAWLSVFREHGVEDIIGIDGTYVDVEELLIPKKCFYATNLANPFSLSKRYDLALALEVAEHLPRFSAKHFVHCLCKLAAVVLFSAAIPGQGGEHHVNEQWPEYWRQLFAEQSYRMFDPFRPVLWHDERVASHYRQNMYVFVQEGVLKTRPNLEKLMEVKNANRMMLVDEYIVMGLRATLTRLPYVMCASFGRRLRRLTNRFRMDPNYNTEDSEREFLR